MTMVDSRFDHQAHKLVEQDFYSLRRVSPLHVTALLRLSDHLSRDLSSNGEEVRKVSQ